MTVPRGIELCELDMEDGSLDELSEIEDAESELGGPEVSCRALMLEVTELTEDFLLEEGASGCSRDTIFIPTAFPVVAGIKSVVTPFFLTAVLKG